MSATLVADASTKEQLRVLERTVRLGDLTLDRHLAYLAVRQNERIIELLESIEGDTTRMAFELEQKR